ncbi:MAG: polymer-forming cytoskeletal protein [Bacteroidales bacterium]|jgi:cytoskeletal protein CcmA (bactofilin family)|nr:polymer-forming cytoskeletal protein [Bacteroidales bacterium]
MAKETENFNSYNIISAGTVIKGEFHTPGNIRIDGEFEGDISTKGRLIVGNSGVIKGTIACQNAELEGMIEATVDVEQHLALKATSKLIGDVKTDKISIETGAVFHGYCRMNLGKSEIPFEKEIN